MLKQLFVLTAVVFLFSSPSLATDLHINVNGYGGDEIYLTNMWDKRNAHSSLDVGGRVGSPGGWFIGLSGPIDTSMGQVSRVELIGSKRTVILTKNQNNAQAFEYYWKDHYETGFNVWFGNRTGADDEYVLQCYDQNNDLMALYIDDELIGTAYGPIVPHIDLPAVDFVTIKNMKVRKNDLMVKVDVPADIAGRTIQLRLRIYDGQDTNRMIDEYKYTAGIPGIIKLSVPSEYAGYTARIEYRAFDNGYPMGRTVTWFTLPAL